MNKKPTVLTFNKFYLPGYRAGGPIRTLSNMVDRLGKEINFCIVTLDRDSRSNQPYGDILHREWNTVGHAQVMYFNPRGISIRQLVKFFNEIGPDVIYLNSFFDNNFTQRILWARRLGLLDKVVPIILAPRGEFSSGALGLKQIKKKIYLSFVKIIGLYSDLVWHVSSKHEQKDLLQTLDFVCLTDVHIAMNLAPVEEQELIKRTMRSNEEPLRVCFLSRISPMKNLNFALKVLAQVVSPVVFTIYGPKEVVSYWEECNSLIASLPANIKVNYLGEIQPHAVKQTLAHHDLFFLPTRGENYGHVIHEALAAGLPVLISDQTPWGETQKREVGWVFPLSSLNPFIELIEEACNWTFEQHEQIAHRAQLFATEKATDTHNLTDNRDLFLNVIASRDS